MSSSRVKVGLPLEKPRSAGRGNWRKGLHWPPAQREPVLGRARRREAIPSEAGGFREAGPVSDLEARPLSLLSVRSFLLLSAIVFAALVLVWGLVRSNHLSVALSYEISALTREKLKLQEINHQLKTELTVVGSLAQLEEAAREVLGLITPNQGQIVVIEP